MSHLWVSVLSAFLPVSLLLAARMSTERPRSLSVHTGTILGALAVSVMVGLAMPRTQTVALNFSVVQVVLLVGFLACGQARHYGWFWRAALIAVAAARWVRSDALPALTATHVINTELLLNLATVAAAFAACALLAWIVCRTIRLTPRLRWPSLAVLSVLLLTPLSGDILLSLMKLQAFELTKMRLSYVAKTVQLQGALTYIVLACVCLLIGGTAWTVTRQRKRVWRMEENPIPKRIALAAYRHVRALQTAAVAVVLVLLSGQLYWDAVASQPPRLSESLRVELDADDQIRLKLDPLMDNGLHRFVWIADDGKTVRFFVINRLPDKVSPAVVFDACLLCGDKGYVLQDDQVVCVGCGVRLFRPSIGKPGGCNPVPFDNWRVENGEIVIPRASLEAGLPIFRSVATIAVVDPVTGAKLTNIDAPHRYVYSGKTYFFADDRAFEAFRADPEKYVKGSET